MRNLELEVSGQNESDNKKNTHGVSPQTHGFLIAAQAHNAFANIDPTTRNSIGIYYGTEVSLRELPNYIGTKSRTSATNRILKGLDRAWEQLPPQVQLQFPKEQVIKLKDNFVSPRFVEKKRENTVTLWKNTGYRQKFMDGVQRRRHEVSKEKPSPMKRKNHTPGRIEQIRSSAQKYWNERHGIPTDDPLAKRKELVTEWQRLSLILGHSPSFKEIAKLKKAGITKFSENMYRKEFGQGSCMRAREELTAITEPEVFPPTIAKKNSLIASQIGKDEKLIWQYAVHHGLLPRIIQARKITEQQLELLRNYFEQGIIGQNLTMEIFNKFTIAVAKVA